MGIARIVLKREDYAVVGDVSREELREIVRVSGVRLSFLILIAIISTLLGVLRPWVLGLVAFALLYPIIRYYAPHRHVTAAYLIPRTIVKSYQIINGFSMREALGYYLLLLYVAMINEKIR